MDKIQISSPEDEYEARLAYYQRDVYQPENYLLSSKNNELTEEVPF